MGHHRSDPRQSQCFGAVADRYDLLCLFQADRTVLKVNAHKVNTHLRKHLTQ